MNPPSAAALAPVQRPAPRWWPALRLLLSGFFVLLTALFLAPSLLGLPRYDVAGGQIVARSLASSTVIPAGTPYQTTSLGLARKLYGTATPGYTVGRFDTLRGEVAVYSGGTSPSNGLLFATTPPTYLTPADPEALLSAWKRGEQASFRAAGSGRLYPVNLFFALLPLLMLGLFARTPRPGYHTQGDTLVIKTRASTTVLPRRQTRASLTAEALGMRLFGTAIPGYYTGTFVTRLGNVQAAASTARPTQAVVLEHGNRRYYLTPSDPAAVAAWFTPPR